MSETGWPNHRGQGHVDEQLAAERALRLILELKLMPAVAGLWFSSMKSTGSTKHSKMPFFLTLKQAPFC